MIIGKKYIVDDNNRKLAVQISIETFNKIEEVLENHSLFQLMNEDKSKVFGVTKAKDIYNYFP